MFYPVNFSNLAPKLYWGLKCIQSFVVPEKVKKFFLIVDKLLQAQKTRENQ
jgi:hypothetical protein